MISFGSMNLLQRVTHKYPKCSSDSSTKSMVIFPSSMKTIPFTVPSSVSSSSCSRRGDQRLLPDGDSASLASTVSETSAPGYHGLLSPPGSASMLGSMESLGSTTSSEYSRGAYALGSIDPSLYKLNDEDDDYDIPEQHIGRIWFAVEYERESEKLLVTLMKAKNLPSRSLAQNNACDPFVRIYLVPDDRRYLQSKFKKKTTNPKFEESFVFQVSNKAIDERVLKLTVYDIDRHKKHVVIGHALYPLKEHNYESNERVVMWRDLEREVTEVNVDRGEVHVSLCYNGHLERLTATIFEGKAFKKTDVASSDFYVKVCIMQQGKVVKSKRTDVVKRNFNPVFNESFTFKLPVASLDMASIRISAMQHVMGQRDKLVGRLVIGSFMFARGKELEHWNSMITNQKEQISQWHTLT